MLEEFDSEVPVAHIGKLVMDELKKLDQVAYVRFASVYRDFKDIHEFLDEIKHMAAAGEAQARKGREKEQRAKDREKEREKERAKDGGRGPRGKSRS